MNRLKGTRLAVMTAVLAVAWRSSAVEGQAAPRVAREVDVATAVVIVVNDAVPDSVGVGLYYAQKRGIPTSQICHLQTTTAEQCTWSQLVDTILVPLKAFLLSRPDALYVVPTFGVPLKARGNSDPIDPDNTTRTCAVDREIELLRINHPYEGWLTSPFYGSYRHFTPSDLIYIVSRLDGPSADSAKALVDNALWAEAHGIEGTSFLDAGALDALGGAYAAYDDSAIEPIASIWQNAGLPHAIDTGTFTHDVCGLPDQAHYWGWYDSDMASPDPSWRFNKGAVGAHIHSFSAATIRHAATRWVGPMVHHGITGTCGTVDEPFLSGFPNGTVFFTAFLQGYTFGESMFISNPWTSWMAVFVGDPLYAPYASNVWVDNDPEDGGGGGKGGSGGGSDGGGGKGGGCGGRAGPPAFLGMFAIAMAAMAFRKTTGG